MTEGKETIQIIKRYQRHVEVAECTGFGGNIWLQIVALPLTCSRIFRKTMKTQAKPAAWDCRKTQICRCHPGLFREEGHFGWVERSFKTIFLPLLSQCFLAGRLQILEMVCGEKPPRQGRRRETMPASEEGQPHCYLNTLASALYISPICVWLSNTRS